MILIYPAIFFEEEVVGYSVFFPGFPFATQGENINDAFYMSTEFLGIQLNDYYEEHKEFPTPLDINKIDVEEFMKKELNSTDEEIKNAKYFKTLVPIDYYRFLKLSDKKIIRKNVSIPRWLNKIGKRNNINFSKVLKEALMKELGIDDIDENYIM
ncbi:type II toxin-antitoxin system HicB family antitoxin [Sneathia vaginalis]|uniref:type II toxin-antitoxin system HicB family antitoxin n=1 Tax=Sneathia vaginalis TaxID=187101 RepID=UPI002889A590|nr:type II toxin-antitoxin system HicB family antitoxin [Sneathia vaginalis]